jgi:hypothetical protein
MTTYAELIRTIARQLAGFHPQDQRNLVEAALQEAAKHDTARHAQEAQ